VWDVGCGMWGVGVGCGVWGVGCGVWGMGCGNYGAESHQNLAEHVMFAMDPFGGKKVPCTKYEQTLVHHGYRRRNTQTVYNATLAAIHPTQNRTASIPMSHGPCVVLIGVSTNPSMSFERPLIACVPTFV
jgi:hypothetical protein